MPTKKYQIFVSSTYEDLKEERRKVFQAILRMGHIPVAMEYFGAADNPSWDIIKNAMETSDYYVLIIGQRYGATMKDASGAEIGYTHREFNYAKELGLPICCFILDDKAPVTLTHREDDHKWDLRKAFIADATTGRNVVWWKNGDELSSLVSTALHNQFALKPQPGWYRQDPESKILSWDAYYQCLGSLVKKVNESEPLGGFNYDIAVGITRGGTSVADLFAREFGQNKPVVSLFAFRDGKNTYFDREDSPISNEYVLELLSRPCFKKILLVDSLTRNGKCIFSAKQYLKNHLPDKTIKTMVVYADEKLSDSKKRGLDYIGELRDLKGKKLSLE